MKLDKINIREVKDDINLILYNCNWVGLKELQVSNILCEQIGGITNEAISVINNFV